MSINNVRTGTPARRPVERATGKANRVTSLILGLWAFASPWILRSHILPPHMQAICWNVWILGAIVTIMSVCALVSPRNSALPTVNALSGLWMAMAPWIVGFSPMPAAFAVSATIAGLAIAVLGMWDQSVARDRNVAAQRRSGRHSRNAGI